MKKESNVSANIVGGGGGAPPLGPSVPSALYVVTFVEKPVRFAQHYLDGEEYKISHRPSYTSF